MAYNSLLRTTKLIQYNIHLLYKNNKGADYSNKANETLVCNYQGDDMEIGFNSRYLIEMLNSLNCDEVQLETSQPSRAGILTPVDGSAQGEMILMLVMPSVIKKQ